jgi:hypothetical protein
MRCQPCACMQIAYNWLLVTNHTPARLALTVQVHFCNKRLHRDSVHDLGLGRWSQHSTLTSNKDTRVANSSQRQTVLDLSIYPCYRLVSLAHKHVVHVVVELFFRLHDLLYQLQRRAQRQTDNVVVRALDALNEDGACRLYAISTSLVVSISRAHIGKNELVGDWVASVSVQAGIEDGRGQGRGQGRRPRAKAKGLPWGSNLTVVSSTCVSIL